MIPRIVTRLFAPSNLRIRVKGPRFELHERVVGRWMLLGMFSTEQEAEQAAQDLAADRGNTLRKRIRPF